MPWRAIQDTLAESESLNSVSAGAERLYFRMLVQTDPFGRLPGSARKIRARCIPLLDVSDLEIEEWLCELEAVDRIVRYQVDERLYIQITNFDENQPREFIRKRNKPVHPPPDKELLQMSLVPESGRKEPENSAPEQKQNRTEIEAGSPTTEASYAERLPRRTHGLNGKLDFTVIAAGLRGSDTRTASVLATFQQRGLPEAAFHTALESLQMRRSRTDVPPLVSEVRYVVAALKKMEGERQYAR